MKFLVLWSNVSDYLLAQLKGLKEMEGEVHLVCLTKSPDAPFDKSHFHSKLSSFSQRETYTAEEILKFTSEIKPDVILVSSWHIKPYANVSKNRRSRITRFVYGQSVAIHISASVWCFTNTSLCWKEM